MKAIFLPILFLLHTSAIKVSNNPKKDLDEYFDADFGSMA